VKPSETVDGIVAAVRRWTVDMEVNVVGVLDKYAAHEKLGFVKKAWRKK
jgi:hypothetical protein